MTERLDRLPPLPRAALNPAQVAAADELIAGPRKGVKGPFIALLRSPVLLSRLQNVERDITRLVRAHALESATRVPPALEAPSAAPPLPPAK